MNVVECTALTKVFRDFWGRDRVRAVDNLDLEIRPGEVFGLLGPNGSGKSTTIKMLLGLLYPTSGAARVFGRPPTDIAIKAQIGFMPEESYLYRYLNAYETLDYYGRLFRLDRYERKRRTEQLVDMVGLKRAGKRAVGTYSKGMARRIGLAQALINDPDLLILDEPTTGLDPIGTRQIKSIIKVLGDRGKTVLLCSHLLADVEDVCDRVSIMYGGRQQAIGSLEDLLTRRDTTQIVAQQLDGDIINQIRQLIRKSGRDVISVDNPTDRLEEMFLRVVAQAQRERLETSGAEAGTEVSEFLSGQKAEAPATTLVDSLVEAGKQRQSDAAVEPVAQTEQPKQDVLQRLKAGESESARRPEAAAATKPAEATGVSRKPDEAVLDRLMKPDRKTSEEQPSADGDK